MSSHGPSTDGGVVGCAYGRAVCTVVCDWRPGDPVRILALRDELTTREFDEPGAWWPDHPGVVGGRDRVAGGSWCVTDIASGVTAMVLNRTERRTGSPSRGVLPLLAVGAGRGWTEQLDHRGMASFTLLLAGPGSVTAWTWDGRDLDERDLDPGRHMLTPSGVDPDDDRTRRWAADLEPAVWRSVLAGTEPSDEPGALVVRHAVPGGGTWATVFGQLATVTPGRLDLAWSRTPWQPASWTEQLLTASS